MLKFVKGSADNVYARITQDLVFPDRLPDTRYCVFLGSLTVIPLETIKDFVNEEIPFVESRQTLYDIFFLILKDQGRSYQSLRRSWIDEHSRQFDLFNGYPPH